MLHGIYAQSMTTLQTVSYTHLDVYKRQGRDWWDAVAASAVGDQGARELFSRTPHRLIECGHFGTGEDVDRPV